MSQRDQHPEILMEQARAGDDAARGRLLELYRNYLQVIARSLIEPELRPLVAASDVVQETYLEAHRHFEQFQGRDEAVLVAWLRTILVRSLANQAGYHRAGRRDVRRQRSIEQALDRSGAALHSVLAGSVSSPSAQAIRREEAVLLADALERLTPEYREVFILRNLDGLAFNAIAAQLGRTTSAVRRAWSRAVVELSRMLEEVP